MESTIELLDEPRWTLAAQALANGCADLADDEAKVALLESVCHGLGDSLYPALLRVLALVGKFGDYPARATVATALVHALRTGRLPAGRLGAWGNTSTGTPGTAFARARSLGPVEYLCVWHAQPLTHGDPRGPLETGVFDQAATALLELIDTAPGARRLYGELLRSVAADPLEGTLTRSTRHALGALADAWISNAPCSHAAASFLAALRNEPSSRLAVLASQGQDRTF